MKTLHLIRHAKSSWADPALDDIARPLNQRGRDACPIMAREIVAAGCNFENVYCSVATRAQLTIQGISKALEERNITWQVEEALYTFHSQDLLHWCHRLDDNLKEAVIIGHNPAMTGFINSLGNRYLENLPTCGYAKLVFPKSKWSSLSPGSGDLVVFLKPKQFM